MAGLQRFGNFIGPLVTGCLAYNFGFDYVFMTLGAVACLAFILVFIFVGSEIVIKNRNSLSLLRIIPEVLVHHRGIFITVGTAIFVFRY